jgi:hypothetical protein
MSQEINDPAEQEQTLNQDVGEEADVRTARQKAALVKDYRAECWRRVLGTREGRAVIWEILGKTGIYEQSHLSTSLVMAAQAGKRDLGISLTSDIFTIEPEAYTLMQREASEPLKRSRKLK